MTSRRRLLMVATIEPTLRAFLLPYADHFRSLGWQVDGMAQGILDSQVCRDHFDQVWDVGWSRNPLALGRVATAHERVRQVVSDQGYGIVHVHTPVAAFVTRHALRHQRRTGLKVVYTAHGFHFHSAGKPLHNRVYHAAERMAARWTDALVVINDEDARAARALGTIAPERVHHMPGIGVDVAGYRDGATDAEARELRAGLGIPESGYLVLMIAEYIPRKRHEDTLAAFARVEAPDAHLVLVGEGPLMDDVRIRAEELGVASRTHVLGRRDDVPALIRAADVTVLPSSQEGLPRSVMESMAVGTPVIGSDIRGTRDLLDAGAGLLFPVGDVDAFAERLNRLVSDRDAAEAIVLTARERIEHYDLSHLIDLHERLYADLSGQDVRSGAVAG